MSVTGAALMRLKHLRDVLLCMVLLVPLDIF